MKIVLRLAVIMLIGIPIASILFKVYGLKLSLLPKPVYDEWTIQVRLDGRNLDQLQRFNFPIPVSSERQQIEGLSFQNQTLDFEFHREESPYHYVTWDGPFQSIRNFGLQFRARTNPENLELPRADRRRWLGPEFQQYLSTQHLSPEELTAIRSIEAAILDTNRDRVDAVKRIFFYVSEEIKRSANYDSIQDAIEIGRATAYTKARVFDALARRAGVPSRISFGVMVDHDSVRRLARHRHRLVWFNEVNLNQKWYPVDLDNQRLGSYPENLVLFHHDLGPFREHLDQLRSAQIYSQPIHVNRYNSQTYFDELRRTDSFFYHTSLYRLPIASQSNLYIVLLLPFGAVILAFFRNILGFSTFGIFTPILLTIFFLETPFVIAFFFMALVVSIGFFQRVLLDKLYLLAVPRISILLTLVIIAYVVFITLNHSPIFSERASPMVLSYFPVVIITVLIERFSIDFVEEGPWNTAKKLIGTLVISFCCYILFEFYSLKLLIFTHPELMLVAIGLNLMIGSYKGYRLSEFLRFRDLARKISG